VVAFECGMFQVQSVQLMLLAQYAYCCDLSSVM